MSATPPDEQSRLTNLVTELTRSAVASSPVGGTVEGAVSAVAAVDRAESTACAAAGSTARFEADGTLLEPTSEEISPVDEGTVFDLASVTKVVTSLTAATLIDEGTLDLDAPVAEQITSPHPDLTARHLLTHTSGLPPVMPMHRFRGGRGERIATISRAALLAEPGATHGYSCIGFILLGTLLEQITGTSLPDLATDRVLGPAGAHHASWSPSAATRTRIAATEYQDDPPRGLVRGSTHDETAWALGGVGNAGLFATVSDVLALGRVLAGRAPGLPLSAPVRDLIGTDQLPDHVDTGSPWAQGLGLRVGHDLPTGELLPRVIGHPGFTGTSVLADPVSGTVAVLLTNRVHPHRTRFTVEGARREIAQIAFA